MNIPQPAPRRTISLRRHLWLASWLIVLLGVIVVLIGIMQFIYRSEQAIWESRLQDAANSATRTVTAYINRVEEYAGVVALLDVALIEDDPVLLDKLLQQNPDLIEIVRVDEDGELLYGVYREGSSPVLMTLVDAEAPPIWLLETKTGQNYVSELQVFAGKEPYITIAVPASDGGAVAVRVQMDLLWDVVNSIHFGDTGVVYLVDRIGYIVAHPDPEVVLARQRITASPDMQPMLIDSPVTIQDSYHSFDGRPVMGIRMPVGSSNWLAFAEIHRHEAFTTTRQAMFLIGGGVLVVGGLISFALAWLLQTQVIVPVRRLRDGALRIGEGDLSYRIPEPSTNEIGVVATAFNEMAARLQEREAALSQAHDEAVAANRFKSRLLANVSHDLMTPLNIILGYADMLREGVHGALNGQQQSIMERVFANAQRLVSLIRSLLDQAQIEAGKLRFSYTPFEVQKLVSNVTGVMEVLAKRKKLSLAAEIDPALPPTLQGDFPRVEQILMNLAGNAVKFTDVGGVGIRLFKQDDVFWGMEVNDTGRGIPQDAVQYIFDPFLRVDNSTTRDTSGIGLGLSIVNQLVTLMGGRIELESEVSKGSTFRVYLPFEPLGDEVDA